MILFEWAIKIVTILVVIVVLIVFFIKKVATSSTIETNRTDTPNLPSPKELSTISFNDLISFNKDYLIDPSETITCANLMDYLHGLVNSWELFKTKSFPDKININISEGCIQKYHTENPPSLASSSLSNIPSYRHSTLKPTHEKINDLLNILKNDIHRNDNNKNLYANHQSGFNQIVNAISESLTDKQTGDAEFRSALGALLFK